jgi:hypothetical protein
MNGITKTKIANNRPNIHHMSILITRYLVGSSIPVDVQSLIQNNNIFQSHPPNTTTLNANADADTENAKGVVQKSKVQQRNTKCTTLRMTMVSELFPRKDP